MLFESLTQKLNQLVTGGAKKNQRSIIDGLLEDSAAWKPAGYDVEVAKRRDFFQDNQAAHLRAELQRRFPKSWQNMSPYVVPLFRHLVEQTATIYRQSPRRQVVVNGAQSDDLTSRAARLYDLSQINRRMHRLEQIAAAARLGFLRVSWDAVMSRIVATPYWPDRVHVIFDPDRPWDLAHSWCVVAELTSAAGVTPDKDQRRYEVWQKRGGEWIRSVTDLEGNTYQDGELYPVLPWVALPFDTPDGALFVRAPADDIDVNLTLDALLTDLLWAISMQAWPTATYSGPKPAQPIVCGPGVLLDAGEAGQFGALSFNPQIAAVMSVANDLVARHLNLNGVDPGSASADPKYESGVALKVRQQPMLERREARIPTAQEAEERELWPIMRALAPRLVGMIPESAELRWYPGQVVLPLDDAAEFDLSEKRVGAEISTWPDEMVRLGLAPNLDEARRIYEENSEAAEDDDRMDGAGSGEAGPVRPDDGQRPTAEVPGPGGGDDDPEEVRTVSGR